MRVLFVSPVSFAKGGAEKVLLDLLGMPGIEPVLAVPEPGELGDEAVRRSIPVGFYYPTALNAVHRPPRISQMVAAVVDVFRCAVRLRRMARQHDCVVVHTNGLKAHAIGIVMRLFGSRVLVHLHDIPYTRSEVIIWRVVALCASRIIVVSRACWPAKLTRKISVLPNAVKVDTGQSPPAQDVQSPLRLGFIGRYHPHKGLDRMLDWMKAVQKSDVAASLVLRGRPDEDHLEYWARISRRIEDEGLKSLVVDQGWRTGPGLFEGIAILLLLPDHPDPAPLSILEAMAHGVPVIAYPIGGIPDLVPEGTGRLVSTPEELIAALRDLRDIKGLAGQLREAALAHVKRMHDPALIAARFVHIVSTT